MAENAKFWHFGSEVFCIEKLRQGGLLVKFEWSFSAVLFLRDPGSQVELLGPLFSATHDLAVIASPATRKSFWERGPRG